MHHFSCRNTATAYVSILSYLELIVNKKAAYGLNPYAAFYCYQLRISTFSLLASFAMRTGVGTSSVLLLQINALS